MYDSRYSTGKTGHYTKQDLLTIDIEMFQKILSFPSLHQEQLSEMVQHPFFLFEKNNDNAHYVAKFTQNFTSIKLYGRLVARYESGILKDASTPFPSKYFRSAINEIGSIELAEDNILTTIPVDIIPLDEVFLKGRYVGTIDLNNLDQIYPITYVDNISNEIIHFESSLDNMLVSRYDSFRVDIGFIEVFRSSLKEIELIRSLSDLESKLTISFTHNEKKYTLSQSDDMMETIKVSPQSNMIRWVDEEEYVYTLSSEHK